MPRPPEYDRSAVIEQAMAVFWERGYGQTSIGDLVEATGLQPGSLYAAFGNKKGVFMEVIDQYNRAFLEKINLLRKDPQPAIEKLEGLLLQAANEQMDGRNQRGCLSVNALLEMSQHDDDIATQLRSYNRRIRKGFAALIADAQAEGQITPGRNADNLATFLMNNIWGMRVMSRDRHDRKGAQAIVDGVMTALRSA